MSPLANQKFGLPQSRPDSGAEGSARRASRCRKPRRHFNSSVCSLPGYDPDPCSCEVPVLPLLGCAPSGPACFRHQPSVTPMLLGGFGQGCLGFDRLEGIHFSRADLCVENPTFRVSAPAGCWEPSAGHPAGPGSPCGLRQNTSYSSHRCLSTSPGGVVRSPNSAPREELDGEWVHNTCCGETGHRGHRGPGRAAEGGVVCDRTYYAGTTRVAERAAKL